MNQTHPSIEQIVDYLHGEVGPAEDAAIHAHLASCPACEERRAEEAAIAEALRADARRAERELPAGVVARIRDAARQSREPGWQRLRAKLRPTVFVPAAAALAAAIYAGLGGWHSAVAPTAIDAASYVNDHAAMAATSPFADEMAPATLTSESDEAH